MGGQQNYLQGPILKQIIHLFFFVIPFPRPVTRDCDCDRGVPSFASVVRYVSMFLVK